jgi:hypothetical protein
MKTPMQELIERLDKEINSKYPDGYNIVMEIAKDLTEQMLEKEKEVIVTAYQQADTESFRYDSGEHYYNETFKTKEK